MNYHILLTIFAAIALVGCVSPSEHVAPTGYISRSRVVIPEPVEDDIDRLPPTPYRLYVMELHRDLGRVLRIRNLNDADVERFERQIARARSRCKGEGTEYEALIAKAEERIRHNLEQRRQGL